MESIIANLFYFLHFEEVVELIFVGLLSKHDFREFIGDALTSHFLPNSQHAMENQLYNTGNFLAFLAISVYFFHLDSKINE